MTSNSLNFFFHYQYIFRKANYFRRCLTLSTQAKCRCLAEFLTLILNLEHIVKRWFFWVLFCLKEKPVKRRSFEHLLFKKPSPNFPISTFHNPHKKVTRNKREKPSTLSFFSFFSPKNLLHLMRLTMKLPRK